MAMINDAKLATTMIGNGRPTMAAIGNGTCEHQHLHYVMVTFDDG